MSEQVKRYDAVHIRYEDSNIRYGEGCEVEVVTASDYEREVQRAIAAGIRMQDKCAALEAECERLRVKLMTIAHAEPARHGIEWAKAHAAEGNNEVYAKWREAIDEAHALAAENARLRGVGGRNALDEAHDIMAECYGTLGRLESERDALHAEAEALRAALLGIASVNPAERGIEWAKSYASDGLKGAGSDLYARWLDTFKEAESLRAENARLRAALEQARELLKEARHFCQLAPSVLPHIDAWLERNA